MNNDPYVDFVLEVTPEGGEPYEVGYRTLVSQMAIPRGVALDYACAGVEVLKLIAGDEKPELARGGAHSIAAMAYGTQSVPKVDKIFGPGNAWVTAAKQPVKNAELWRQLDALVHDGTHKIAWHWVKGHSGDPGNERADALANLGAASVVAKR